MMAKPEGKTLFSGASGRVSRSRHMKALINRFKNDEDGATAIEYGLIAALIAVAIIAALNAVSSSLSTTFDGVSTALDNA